MYKSNKPREGNYMTQLITVDIKDHQDWHCATSADLPGLFVAHHEYEVVKHNIPECIQMILEHNTKGKVTVFEQVATSPLSSGQRAYAVMLEAA